MRRPEFIARQSAHPRGLLGRVLAWIMERETSRVNDAAIELLNPRDGEHILDLGCGHGRSLARLASRAAEVQATGVDQSGLMCALARRRHRRLIEQGGVRVVQATSDALPLGDGSYDAVLSVHTIYFWQSLPSHLREIGRVLREGGRIVVAFRTSSDPASRMFPSGIYVFRSEEEISAAVRTAGFSEVRTVTMRGTGIVCYLSARKVPADGIRYDPAER